MNKQLIDLCDNFEMFFEAMQVDRSIVFSGDVVPLHTHNGNDGFLYMIAGSCKIDTYESQEKNGVYQLRLVSSKVYKPHDYAILTKENNVHQIEVLEDGVILDVFNVSENQGNFQTFLKVIDKQAEGIMTAVAIPFDEANISPRMLQAYFKQIYASGSDQANSLIM